MAQYLNVWSELEERTELKPPDFKKGILKVNISDGELVPGVSKRLNSKRWSVYHNKVLGWICIGEPDFVALGIEFIPGCVAILHDNTVRALWLLPERGLNSI
jgi:hypothetical protein